MNRDPLLRGHTNGPGRVCYGSDSGRGGGVSGHCTGKALSDSDIPSTVVTVVHRVAVGPGHRWSSAHICYSGQILMNSEGVDLLVFTPMDHHSVSGVQQGPMTWGCLYAVLRRAGLE